MTSNYILIDFENVQPRNLDLLIKHPFGLYLFVGANQNKVPLDLARAMQAFGDKAHYIEISGNGRNALDFHIAAYLGELSSKEPDAGFFVVSRDKGFDPLLKHLRSRKIKAQRVSDIAEIPSLRTQSSSPMDEKINVVVKNLKGRGQSRPRKVKTLLNTIRNLFQPDLDEQELQGILERLQERKLIQVKEGGNLSYRLPRGKG